jgi:hypothetical protein
MPAQIGAGRRPASLFHCFASALKNFGSDTLNVSAPWPMPCRYALQSKPGVSACSLWRPSCGTVLYGSRLSTRDSEALASVGFHRHHALRHCAWPAPARRPAARRFWRCGHVLGADFFDLASAQVGVAVRQAEAAGARRRRSRAKNRQSPGSSRSRRTGRVGQRQVQAGQHACGKCLLDAARRSGRSTGFSGAAPSFSIALSSMQAAK